MVKKYKTGIFGKCCALIALILLAVVLKSSYNEGISNIDNASEPQWVTDAKKMYGDSHTNTKRSNYVGTPVPLPEGEMFFFKKNQFKPECCPATYTTSAGCACISKDQLSYLNNRGGNRGRI